MATASSSSAGAGSSIAWLPVRAYHATTNASMPSLHESSAVSGASILCASGAPSGPAQRGRVKTDSIVSGWRL